MMTTFTALATTHKRRGGWAIGLASLLALGDFAWPFALSATPEDSRAAVSIIALALVPALIVAVSMIMDRSLSSASAVALLGVLAAVGSIVRITTVGIAGVETIFIVLILAGRVLGARFAFLLGLITVAVSSVIMGSLGPWTPFQMFACAWVGAGAGLLPFKNLRGWRELTLLAGYGFVAAYLFGALMNLWFWPFAVGAGTSISYDVHANAFTNLSHFGLYTLVTSTLTWDTVRALTTVVGIALVGRYVLRALRRTRA
jgi:hypothetical protein